MELKQTCDKWCATSTVKKGNTTTEITICKDTKEEAIYEMEKFLVEYGQD